MTNILTNPVNLVIIFFIILLVSLTIETKHRKLQLCMMLHAACQVPPTSIILQHETRNFRLHYDFSFFFASLM